VADPAGVSDLNIFKVDPGPAIFLIADPDQFPDSGF
jgi:hypothetical protein